MTHKFGCYNYNNKLMKYTNGTVSYTRTLSLNFVALAFAKYNNYF